MQWYCSKVNNFSDTCSVKLWDMLGDMYMLGTLCVTASLIIVEHM